MEFLVAGDVGEWRDDEKEQDEDDVAKTDRKSVTAPKILILKSTGQGAGFLNSVRLVCCTPNVFVPQINWCLRPGIFVSIQPCSFLLCLQVS